MTDDTTPEEFCTPLTDAEFQAIIDFGKYKFSAQSALDASDNTVLRCYENGVTVPAEWIAYRKALRTIVAQTSGTPTDLPTRPDYPAGA